MGFLTEGETLTWEKAKEYADYIRKHGIDQFLNIYRNTKNRTNDALLWGDEVEYLLVRLDEENHKVKLSLHGHEVISEMEKTESAESDALWRPEYGRHMIEGTPGHPYGRSLWKDFAEIETNMKLRRQLISENIDSRDRVITLTNYPLMGVGDFTEPSTKPGGDVANSLFTSDDMIHPHHRFATLTRNIRLRKGSHVSINMPIFMDKNTKVPTYEKERAEGRNALDGHIYMDSMAFGMGMCCLQTTFQACNIYEARHFYDQLAVMSPIMLAITAGTPILRGLLADTDVRWDIIAGSVDDRTPEEFGKTPLKTQRFVIPKSRYDSISTYLSRDFTFRPEYNDYDLVIDHDIYKRLRDEGIDHLLAQHIAHLWIRDPLVIYDNKIEIDDEKYADHFENLQSTNWQTVRFKPPPPGSTIGWRVEFRPMEACITDFENAAFVAFTVLMTRVIASYDLNLYIPISKVDENMKRAHKRDAVNTEKFYFRKNITSADAPNTVKECVKYRGTDGPFGDEHQAPTTPVEDEYTEMTINEIMNGKSDGSFPGLIPLMTNYIDAVEMDVETRVLLQKYLQLISQRASGKLLTTAAWIRKFVREHPTYKFDSVVTEDIAFDLVNAAHKIAVGEMSCPELLAVVVREVNQ